MENGRHTKNSKALIITLGLLIIVVVTLVVAIIIARGDEDQPPQPTQPETSDFHELEAMETTNQPTATEYIKEIDQKIASAATAEEQAQLYTDRAIELHSRTNLGEGNFAEQILSDLHKAEELAPTAATAYQLYNFERLYGDEETANNYLELAKERGFVANGGGA